MRGAPHPLLVLCVLCAALSMSASAQGWNRGRTVGRYYLEMDAAMGTVLTLDDQNRIDASGRGEAALRIRFDGFVRNDRNRTRAALAVQRSSVFDIIGCWAPLFTDNRPAYLADISAAVLATRHIALGVRAEFGHSTDASSVTPTSTRRWMLGPLLRIHASSRILVDFSVMMGSYRTAPGPITGGGTSTDVAQQDHLAGAFRHSLAFHASPLFGYEHVLTLGFTTDFGQAYALENRFEYAPVRTLSIVPLLRTDLAIAEDGTMSTVLTPAMEFEYTPHPSVGLRLRTGYMFPTRTERDDHPAIDGGVRVRL